MRLFHVAALALTTALATSCTKRSSVTDAGVSAPSEAWLSGQPLPERSAPRDGGSLVVRVPNEPPGLNTLADPFRAVWALRTTHRLVHETLVELNGEPLAVTPGLARSWTASADSRTVRFELREDARFHDGTPLSADDVVATFDEVLSPKRPTSSLKAELKGLLRWQALDAGVVELSWAAASPHSLRKLAQVPIFAARDVRGDWAALADKPNGTGPFKLVEWKRGERLTLERSGTWWGGTPPLDRIVFRFVKDHAVAATAFEKGEFDLMTSVLPSHWRALEGSQHAWAQRGYQRLRGQDNAYSFIAWNGQSGATADVRVRQALAKLFPSVSVTRLVDLGLATPTTCPFYVRGPSCEPTLQHGAVDLDGAKGLLADAGFTDSDGDGVVDRDGKALDVPVLVPAQATQLVKLLALYQEQALQAGVRLRAEPVEAATLTPRIDARDFVAVSRLWATTDTQTDLRFAFHSTERDGGMNFVGLADGEVDRLIDAVDGELDEDRRHALERQLHRRLFELQPVLILSARQPLDLAKTRVHGLVPSVAWFDLRRVWVSD